LKALINDIITFTQTAITGGTINVNSITVNDVYKGYAGVPDRLPRGPYIVIDDGGERTELNDSNTAQNRFYSVIVECGVYVMDREEVLNDILDLYGQIKGVFELEINRQKDGMIFGVDVRPMDISEDDRFFWRARQCVVDYYELEDTFFQY
jgi:hypothetical protein